MLETFFYKHFQLFSTIIFFHPVPNMKQWSYKKTVDFQQIVLFLVVPHPSRANATLRNLNRKHQERKKFLIDKFD